MSHRTKLWILSWVAIGAVAGGLWVWGQLSEEYVSRMLLRRSSGLIAEDSTTDLGAAQESLNRAAQTVMSRGALAINSTLQS